MRYHTLCMLQFYFFHVCGRIYCSTSLACIVFCFTSRNVRKVVCVRHFTVVVYLIVVKVTFSFFFSLHTSPYYIETTFHTRHIGIRNVSRVYTRFSPLRIRHLI